MKIEKVNIGEKLNQINDYWNPRIVGELNGQHVKLTKLKGEFVWHKHDEEDEMFLIVSGEFTMELRDGSIDIKPGEFIIIPKGVEHRPVAKDEVHLMLFEPASTLNTGNVKNEFTKEKLQHI
jgi:mannose-6-phosphate isomerase-like protein (cupin superfamily)